MSQEQVARVLSEHAFHLITPVDLDDVNGPWQVECNCDSLPIQGPSFLGAEAAFAAHQADMLAPLFIAARADALRNAAGALEIQPSKLRAQYVATLRLYANEPWRLDPTTNL